MPDSESALNLIIDSTFNPKGMKDARSAIDRTERSFRSMSKTMSGAKVAKDIERVVAPVQSLGTASLAANQQFQRMVPTLTENVRIMAGVNDELTSIAETTKLLKAEYRMGLISGRDLKESLGALRQTEHQLRSMTFAERKAALARRAAMEDAAEATLRADEIMRQHNLTAEHVSHALEDYQHGVVTLARDLKMTYSEASRFAEDFTKKLALQEEMTKEASRSAKEMASGMGFLGSIKRGFENIGQDLISAGKGFAGTVLQVPRQLAEGVKDGLSNAFSSRPITRAIAEIPKRMFSATTLKRTALFGPLGFISGMLRPSQPKKPEFERVGEGGGVLGSLGKSLTTFGGIIKTALGAFGPAALLLKALEPALRTLMWALEPLLAPLQQLLSDAVMQLVPFISELSKEFVVLAEQLLPPITELIQQIMPIMMDLVRTVLPPLTQLLKMMLSWFGKVTQVLAKVLIPVIGWLGEKLVWLADKIGSFFEWIAEKIGGVLEWFGFDLGLKGTEETAKKITRAGKGMMTEPGAQEMGAAAPRAIPGVNVQGPGVAGTLLPMTVEEAGGARAFRKFSEPRQTTVPLEYREGQLMSGRRDLTAQAIREVFKEQPSVVSREEPERVSEPVVKAIDKMTDRLIMLLPKRIGEETKSVTLPSFGAVTA